MPVDLIPYLIDKTDNVELIRDQIAAILYENQLNQQLLATAAAKDPNQWKLNIFTEAASPFEKWLNVETGEVQLSDADKTPIVNVWFENETFPEGKGNVVKTQAASAIYNVDIYGLGLAGDDGDGQILADKAAAFEAQRATRLVRNILMAAQNTYLQARGVVGMRWIQSVSAYQPRLGDIAVQNVLGIRLAFRVDFQEISPQEQGVDLDSVFIEVQRDEDGEIKTLAEAEYDYQN